VPPCAPPAIAAAVVLLAAGVASLGLVVVGRGESMRLCVRRRVGEVGMDLAHTLQQ
jgi:hypothetical protein